MKPLSQETTLLLLFLTTFGRPCSIRCPTTSYPFGLARKSNENTSRPQQIRAQSDFPLS
jgi:hypothetical protein